MAIRDIHNAWRDHMVPATFRGIEFHVEVDSRASGRRTVVHEYPKRNLPYSEDMGRHAVRWSFTAYLIHGDRRLARDGVSVIDRRDRLIDALEQDDAGTLVHPTMDPMLVMCERYSVSESRQRGGYFEFDLQFVEAGAAVQSTGIATAQVVTQTADRAIATGTQIMNNFLETFNRGLF